MKSRQRYGLRYRPVVAVAAVAGIVLGAAACGSSSSGTTTAGSTGPVTISIDCAPPAAQQPVQDEEWLEDVALFEKANPNITIHSVYNYPCDADQAQFAATLRAGTETNLYYTYFTDLPQVLLAGQAAYITKYVNSTTVPELKDIAPGSLKAVRRARPFTACRLPTTPKVSSTTGRSSSEAGLNPDDPPKTWAEVEADATTIAKLGGGIEGWGDYSAGNNGGWHFSSYIDARAAASSTTAAPPRRRTSTTPTGSRSCRRCTRCGSPTTR